MTGHVNYTLIAPGVYETWGNNISLSSGVQNEAYKLSDPTRNSVQISLTQDEFNRVANFARSADLLNNQYYGLCNNCVDFLNASLKIAGKGDWAAERYLRDGSLVDDYARISKDLCTDQYVDTATSSVLNILSSPSNINEAKEFIEHMSWLSRYDNGSDFYLNEANYKYANPFFNPDAEADYRLYLLKKLGQKLGLSVDYDEIEQKVTLGVASPIAIDLDGDGIETTEYSKSSVYFDIDGDGFKDRSAWLSSDDAFLAIDENGNGQIDGALELFGGMERGDGFRKLINLDGNGDGLLDGLDANYSQLLVWQDVNTNGTTDAGELQKASHVGIESISLDYRSEDLYQNDNLLGEFSTAVFNGRMTAVVDVYFRFKSVESFDDSSYDVDYSGVTVPHDALSSSELSISFDENGLPFDDLVSWQNLTVPESVVWELNVS